MEGKTSKRSGARSLGCLIHDLSPYFPPWMWDRNGNLSFIAWPALRSSESEEWESDEGALPLRTHLPPSIFWGSVRLA